MFRSERLSRFSGAMLMLCACSIAVVTARPLLSQDEASI